MRVLILHSRYRSGPLSGENRVVTDEAELLRRAGHEVDLLAPSAEGESRATLALRTLTSSGIGREVRRRVQKDGVSIVHLHNAFPALGPEVIRAAAEAGAAVVVTLHNFRLLCIAGTFFRDGRVCEACFRRTPWPGVVHGCYRRSRLQSSVVATSLVGSRLRGTLTLVHRFLAVSDFLGRRHAAAGLPADRIVVKPNFVPAFPLREGPGSYFLVLGRLSAEKGVGMLVEAWSPSLAELRIVGDGPERPVLERLATGSAVRFVGSLSTSEVPTALAGARALLVPSVCYEGQPRAILEAYAAGVPVVASRIGGLGELVVDGVTGFTVSPADPNAWRDAVRRLLDDEVSLRLGAGARACWQERFTPERALDLLERAYREALAERDRSAA
ncbi:MAG: glycosyltransferase family 4 protein [Thermoleophilia bacterium]|nr:glycosyltransferase family 4 protein [Thermoleophilia bacterium]